jgi:glycosyltransferase involved in cell wall biosynthesis
MKSILILVPYENVYPPMNGGMQRCFHIIHQLAKYHDLTLVTTQISTDFKKAIFHYQSIAGIKIYSTKDEPAVNDLFSLLPQKFQQAFRYRWYNKNFISSADGLYLQYHPVLSKLLQNNKYDVIILENLAGLNAISLIRKFDRQVKIVYDAHNVDSNLAKRAVSKGTLNQKRYGQINRTEKRLHKMVNAIFTCSNNDRNDFLNMNDHLLTAAVIPNGVEVFNRVFDAGVKQSHPEYILFCGSLGYPANSEGLQWFYNDVWPVIRNTFPDLKLLVVGSGTPAVEMQLLINDSSIEFSGTVDDVKPWYNKAAIAIVPLLSGSGTRLKILEAMSLGLPVVSTSIGAEGIAYRDGQDILIADTWEAFASAIIKLLRNGNARIDIQQAAIKLINEKYDWDIIGRLMADFIEEKLTTTNN